MTNYIKATDFASKDALLSGDPNKIVKGTEINDEFAAIQTAVNSKADTISPTLTGTPLAPTAALGTNTTQIATTAFVQNATSSFGTIATQNSNSISITGGDIVGITDLAVADGGTGASTAANARTNLGVPANDGTGATGTWNISISGNAATANSATTAGASDFLAVGSIIAAFYKSTISSTSNNINVLAANSSVAGTSLAYVNLATGSYSSSSTSGGITFISSSPPTLRIDNTTGSYPNPTGATTLSGTWRVLSASVWGVYSPGETDWYYWYPILLIRTA